jgi:hypothetical protein
MLKLRDDVHNLHEEVRLLRTPEQAEPEEESSE